METFWKWLMRANARALYACAIVVLALATAWWTWREFQPVDSLAPIAPGTDRERPSLPLGVLAQLQRQVDEGSAVPDNLFLISRGPRAVVPVQRPPRTIRFPTRPPRQIAQPEPKPEPEPEPEPIRPPPPPPPPPEPRVSVSLTYHGLFTRPDGRTLALVEDSESGARRFYQPGDPVHGMTIESASFGTLTVKDAGNTTVSLRMGEPQLFEDGHHAP